MISRILGAAGSENQSFGQCCTLYGRDIRHLVWTDLVHYMDSHGWARPQGPDVHMVVGSENNGMAMRWTILLALTGRKNTYYD